MQIAVPVKVDVDVNLDTLSIFMAQAMLDIAQAVGCNDCEDTLDKGVVKRHIIEKMMIQFIVGKGDSKKIVGKIILSIDWNLAQFLAEGSLAQELSKNFGNGQAFIPQVTNGLLANLKLIANKMKTERKVNEVRSVYHYCSEYKNGAKYEEAMAFLGHVHSESYVRDTHDMNKELEMSLDAFRGMFNVKVRY